MVENEEVHLRRTWQTPVTKGPIPEVRNQTLHYLHVFRHVSMASLP